MPSAGLAHTLGAPISAKETAWYNCGRTVVYHSNTIRPNWYTTGVPASQCQSIDVSYITGPSKGAVLGKSPVNVRPGRPRAPRAARRDGHTFENVESSSHLSSLAQKAYDGLLAILFSGNLRPN